MPQYIDKNDLVLKIEKAIEIIYAGREYVGIPYSEECIVRGLQKAEDIINTLEVIDPYEQYIQYASIESGIKAHAENYSFNIESELFNQLSKEQQVIWCKEIEQACISGGYAGVELARDPRYNENLEVKEVDNKHLERKWDDKDIQNFNILEALINQAVDEFNKKQSRTDTLKKLKEYIKLMKSNDEYSMDLFKYKMIMDSFLNCEQIR